MAKYLNVKVKYEDGTRKVAATEVKKERGRLNAFNGDKLVAEFSDDVVEYWSLDEGEAAKTTSA
jgi:hypothetical protein